MTTKWLARTYALATANLDDSHEMMGLSQIYEADNAEYREEDVGPDVPVKAHCKRPKGSIDKRKPAQSSKKAKFNDDAVLFH